MITLKTTTFRRAREREVKIAELRARRRRRFRILVCVNGTDPSYEGVKLASRIGRDESCDIILLYVRKIDQGLNAGGLQVRVARQNMLEWGLELPGIQYLNRGLEILMERNLLGDDWDELIDHTDVLGDPLGDNKVEYRSESGKSIVLKLKIAPDVSSGILDQYELGPYNLIIMGPPKRWRGEFRSFIEPSSVQKVAMLAPCSVMTVRGDRSGKGYLLCTDGNERTNDALTRAAVLAHFDGEPVSIIAAAPVDTSADDLEHGVNQLVSGLAKKEIKVQDAKVTIGDPVATILDAARSYSVVAVADSGKSKLTRFISGSVAFDVMGQSEVSVLNIR